ncbi:MAG: hypothetical protein ABEI52_12350, partial [Halobacteriaceae archaeon]
HPEPDPGFSQDRQEDGFQCPVARGEWAWQDCSKFKSTSSAKVCRRCGLEEYRVAHDESRPLLEEHHLSYPDEGAPHLITVTLCRWCHSKVHNSFARIDDDASPDPEAMSAIEFRRSRGLEERSFDTAAERRNEDE